MPANPVWIAIIRGGRMKLYTTKNSGNGYKVSLLLSMLGVKYGTVLVDSASGEHRKQPCLSLNPYPSVQAWIKRFDPLPGYFKIA
jgi:hypothetical protein